MMLGARKVQLTLISLRCLTDILLSFAAACPLPVSCPFAFFLSALLSFCPAECKDTPASLNFSGIFLFKSMVFKLSAQGRRTCPTGLCRHRDTIS